MAEVSNASEFITQVNGAWGLKEVQEASLAHKNKKGTYTSDGAGMTVTLGVNEGYVHVTTTSGGAITLNLPDVSVAAGREYTVNFTKASTDLTCVYTGTGTGNLVVSSSSVKVFTSNGSAWAVA